MAKSTNRRATAQEQRRDDEAATQLAQALYTSVFGERWPKGWTMMWNVDAITVPKSKVIVIMEHGENVFDSFYGMETLFHEFMHMRNPRLKHGARFDAKAKALAKEARKVMRKAKKAVS